MRLPGLFVSNPGNPPALASILAKPRLRRQNLTIREQLARGGVPRLLKGLIFLHPPSSPSVAAEISLTTSEFQESQRLDRDSIFVRLGLSIAAGHHLARRAGIRRCSKPLRVLDRFAHELCTFQMGPISRVNLRSMLVTPGPGRRVEGSGRRFGRVLREAGAADPGRALLRVPRREQEAEGWPPLDLAGERLEGGRQRPGGRDRETVREPARSTRSATSKSRRCLPRPSSASERSRP